jgi:hypothetical protein
MADINPRCIVVDCRYQASFIPSNVKNRKMTYLVSTWERFPEFCEGSEPCVFYNSIPGFKSRIAIGMFGGEF